MTTPTERLGSIGQNQPVITPVVGATSLEGKTDSTGQNSLSSLSNQFVRATQTNRKACWVCRTRVGYLGFECKCLYVFCAKHRYPEDHICSFDWKKAHRDFLQVHNPKIIAKKIDKI